MKHVLRVINVLATVVILVAFVVLLRTVFTPAGEIPTIMGYGFMRTLTGSMEPAIPVHSFIVVDTDNSQAYQVGDIITFHSSDDVLEGSLNTIWSRPRKMWRVPRTRPPCVLPWSRFAKSAVASRRSRATPVTRAMPTVAIPMKVRKPIPAPQAIPTARHSSSVPFVPAIWTLADAPHHLLFHTNIRATVWTLYCQLISGEWDGTEALGAVCT